MTPTIMAIIMLAIIIGFVFYKKVPIQFVLAVVPIICALFLGFSLNKVSGYAVDSINSTMKSVGYMLLFAFMYFTLLSETGMFDIIVGGFIRLTKGKVNVYIVMIMTTIIAGFGALTASVASAYLVVFPVMITLYKKLKFDRKAAMIIAQTAISAMCFVPWGVGIGNSAVFAKVDPLTLAKQVIPISLCFIPVIILQWIYFGIRHKKQVGSTGIVADVEETVEKKQNSNSRPQFLWINLIIFICTLVALAYLKYPPYMVFIFATLLTTVINYPNPKDYRPLWAKGGATFFNTLLMYVAISIFVGIFNQTGMIKGISSLIVSIFPTFLARYIHIILLAVCVVILRFVPYQLYNSLYPLLISIGASFGLSGFVIIAPFVTNLALATGSSPMTPTTHIGTGLLEIDVEEYSKTAVPIQTVTNILVIIIGMIVGAIK
ncbi:SLC13 family permease [Clostridium sp. HV4-5-A1G]|uniref:SLC13 family permease n=1 Tax=Clostridium sp. HV4-5-A1G TaxID=2004595 RepID=UPI0012396C4C|nr:SLC13 family permease [Clostridium sp. HV4-5-A1G]KAA8669675.1 citrate transporter [Clostridium sp. HV4-5-A1G]